MSYSMHDDGHHGTDMAMMDTMIQARLYLKALKAVLGSYLNKEFHPLDRIYNIWYALFFFRYWRQWLLLVPSFSLGYNFITRNAYLCVELNAHALIMFMRTLWDTYPGGACPFQSLEAWVTIM